MGFLLKTAFWLSLVLLVIPIDRQAAGIAQGPTTFETLSAVRTVVTDVRGFCERNVQACHTGSETVTVLRQKAVYSAGIIQTWLAQNDAQASQPLQVDNQDGMEDDMAQLIEASSRLPTTAYPPI